MNRDKPSQAGEKMEVSEGAKNIRDLLLEAQGISEKMRHMDELVAEMTRRAKKSVENRSKLKKERNDKQREISRIRVVTEDEMQVLEDGLEKLVAEQKEIQEREAPKKSWLGNLLGGKDKEFEGQKAKDLQDVERRIKEHKDRLQWAKSGQSEMQRNLAKIAQIDQELSELDGLDAANERTREDASRQKEDLKPTAAAVRAKMIQALLAEDVKSSEAEVSSAELQREDLDALSGRLRDRYFLDEKSNPKSEAEIEIQKNADELLGKMKQMFEDRFSESGSTSALTEEIRDMVQEFFMQHGKEAESVSIEHKRDGREGAGEGRRSGSISLNGQRVAGYTEYDDGGMTVDWQTEEFRKAIKGLRLKKSGQAQER